MTYQVQGGYYGQPNLQRAAELNDPRQCVWRGADEPSSSEYTGPLVQVSSSTDGIIEFAGDHFDGQLRGNLLAAKYGGPLKRIILTADGSGVIPESDPVIDLVGTGGLDVTQAPNGNLFEIRYPENEIYVQKPDEASTGELRVNAVFPRRGGLAGGNSLSIYGFNLNKNPVVTVGGSSCPVQTASATKIVCKLPGGSGTVDIVLTAGKATYTFKRGYRYIAGS